MGRSSAFDSAGERVDDAGFYAVQIFCDESGGSMDPCGLFLVAAVYIKPTDAARLIKAFRKNTKISDEVKGHLLTHAQRKVFFDLLARETQTVSAVVACSRTQPRGAWAMRNLAEASLYGWLLTEACSHLLPQAPGAGHLTVTPDGGRYQKAVSDRLRVQVRDRLASAHRAAKVSVAFDHSHRLAGLQIADVVANSAFQSFAAADRGVTELLEPVRRSGQLRVHAVGLEGVCPAWLDPAAGTEIPPGGGISQKASALRRSPRPSD
jgi:hypothetical protein